ncbi:MAG TPA: helicase-related protein [Ohtaekwangia sp.]|nr:helicase-related protein [Ohtaekwangia sp.]
MSKTLEKRDDLQSFIKEQIVGPGAFNKRFFLLKKWPFNEFQGQRIKECGALSNSSEIISEVPAYQYSSAILFPIANPLKESSSHSINDPAMSADDNDAEDEITKTDDENFDDDKSESVSSKNQNYPNTCGLSFAVSPLSSLSNDIDVTLRFRTYTKLSQDECREQNLAYYVSENEAQIEAVVNKYFSQVFSTQWIDENLFVFLKAGVDINDHLYTLDYRDLERFVKEEVVVQIKAKFPDGKFFETVTRTYDKIDFTFTSLYAEQLNEAIVNNLKSTPRSFPHYKDLISIIEVYHQVKEIITELKSIYRRSSKRNRPTPMWESNTHLISIKLVEMANDKRIVRGELPIPGFKQLYLNYQYLQKQDKLSGRDSWYVKLILVNRMTIDIKEDEPPQLNKKDEANEKSFFGVDLRVSESKNGILMPYNPPNLLNIDEEDNFNKLLYRKFKDFGEGYNTSVTWGESQKNLKYVSTDFLPYQDTPKVDFRPSRVIEDQVVPRFNSEILSIRSFSTLSDRTDTDILKVLDSFVEEYKIWIIEKEVEMGGLSINGKDLLSKQLKGCQIDYERLKRNLSLLKSDKHAISAFRLMNTAMFMQLHHSINTKRTVKNSEPPYVPTENGESFYRNVHLESDYQWRSFQLAFIILNIDAFVRPTKSKHQPMLDLFETKWPERNEIADLIWFPTGGGKTEAYLGIIALAILYRRFTKGDLGNGTTVLMRYTLRLLTLQQFQRATLLICALEVIRKDGFTIPHNCKLGDEKITIGLFVGADSLPNRWKGQNSMYEELKSIKQQVANNDKIVTKLPYTHCPWCGGSLFVDNDLNNVFPNREENYGIDDRLSIVCNTIGCTFHHKRPTAAKAIPFVLFDEDIYKFPPTLLFGTVDKFAALANKVSTITNERNQDSRRIFGRGKNQKHFPPDLIIQDELHLLLGPLGSAVGLFEKAIDELCSYKGQDGITIWPKVITSTATTRNTDKQIFALFNRRSEIFPKQGIDSDDSFFSYYERKSTNINEYESNRRYVGLLPIGKTQVWMQLRVASICLVHRLKFLKSRLSKDDVFSESTLYKLYIETFNYYHTVLSYFNSLKEVGKTQSQLGHYLPGDVNLIRRNTIPWSFFDHFIRANDSIDFSELTGRLSGEEVKTHLSKIEKNWNLTSFDNPPEFVIATNMISVGIDVSRFNIMIINSMPRNTAEYIQASSRVARDKEGIVFTVHHPFRSRDISHYQRFKEFHEKFYGYVEPISVTPFANKALERYLGMYLAVIIRHNDEFNLSNNTSATNITEPLAQKIKLQAMANMKRIKENASRLNEYLKTRKSGINADIEGIIDVEELADIERKLHELCFQRWLDRKGNVSPPIELVYRDENSFKSLFNPRNGTSLDNNWNVKQSLREIAPSVVIKTVQQ